MGHGGRNGGERSCRGGGGSGRRKAVDGRRGADAVMERATGRTCKVRYGNRRGRRHVMHTDRRVAGPGMGTARRRRHRRSGGSRGCLETRPSV